MPAFKLSKSLLFSSPANAQPLVEDPASDAQDVLEEVHRMRPAEVLDESTRHTEEPTGSVALAEKPSTQVAQSTKSPDFLSADRVKAAAKTLWGKSKKAPLTKKAGRTKMLELIKWLSSKHGWRFSVNASQTYRNRTNLVEGWVHGLLEHENRKVAIEVCYELDEAILLKLWAAYVEGTTPLLLWMGVPTTDAALSAKLCKAFGARPVTWLKFSQLEAQV